MAFNPSWQSVEQISMDLLHRETESDHENNRDWSDLSPDLVRLVSKNLCDIFDFVRFCTVCKHWCSAALASDHRQPLVPCLFGRKSNYFLLYSLPFGETHKINFPNPQGMINFPEPRHWIFTGSIEHPIFAGTVDPVSWFLINPLTNNEVILPAINNYCFPCNMIGLNHIAVYGCVKKSNTHYLAWSTTKECITVLLKKLEPQRSSMRRLVKSCRQYLIPNPELPFPIF